MGNPKYPRVDLKRAEEKVVKAFEEREAKVLVGRLPVGDQILRGDFLRDLFLGNYGDWEPRQVLITEAKIDGRLVLDYCEIHHPILFGGCYFPEGISLVNSNVPILSLHGCEVQGSERGYFLSTSNALNASGLKAGQVVLNGEFIADGDVTLIGAVISESLFCSGGKFKGGIFAQTLRAGLVFFDEKFEVEGDVNLSYAVVSEQFNCNSGVFKGNFNAQCLNSDRVLLSSGFRAKSVNLTGSVIRNQLVCNRGIFEGDLIAQQLKAGNVLLLDGFIAKGNVNLTGAEIDGQLGCDGGIFEKNFTAQSMKAGDVFLRNRFTAKGDLDLVGAEIDGQLDCDGGVFEKAFTAQKLKAEDVLLRDGFTAKGKVDLLGATIRGRLDCQGSVFGGSFNLTGGKSREFQSNKASWPKKGALHLGGFCYERLVGDVGESAEAGLEWLSRMEDGDFYPQPYEQLMAAYRRMGHTNWARKIGFELEKRRHQKFKKIRKSKDSDRPWWNAWYWILRWTIGYGYKPFRSIFMALGMWTVGTLVFGGANLCDCGFDRSLKDVPALFLGAEDCLRYSSDLIRPLEWDALISKYPIPEHYPQFAPAIYALEALFPVFEFGQLDKWHPGNIWLRSLRWGMTFFGTALLAILALFGVGALGPRWREGGDSG